MPKFTVVWFFLVFAITSGSVLAQDADVSITDVDSPDPVATAQVLSCVLSVTNNGRGIAQNVVLVDVIPTGKNFRSVGFNGGASGVCTQPAAGATGTCHCTFASLPVSQSAVCTLGVNVLAATTGTISDTATVGTTTNDPAPANNGATTTAAVTAHTLDIDANGQADAFTDGIPIIRHLFWLRGDSLIAGAVAPDATRTAAGAIEAKILMA